MEELNILDRRDEEPIRPGAITTSNKSILVHNHISLKIFHLNLRHEGHISSHTDNIIIVLNVFNDVNAVSDALELTLHSISNVLCLLSRQEHVSFSTLVTKLKVKLIWFNNLNLLQFVCIQFFEVLKFVDLKLIIILMMNLNIFVIVFPLELSVDIIVTQTI